ncbi:MAG: hypothetical protein ACMXYM_02000 [Candidatus Woesearchaeota archaeon]
MNASNLSGEHYVLAKNLAPTGHEIWIASHQMPGVVPRLDDLLDTELGESFRKRADERLEVLSSQLGRDVRAVNYGRLPLVARISSRRDEPSESDEERGLPKLEDAGVVIPGDAKKRLYGVLVSLPSGSASVQRPSFYGPIFPPRGKPQWQFLTGGLKRERNGSHPLHLAYKNVRNLLNSESTYAEIVRFHG